MASALNKQRKPGFVQQAASRGSERLEPAGRQVHDIRLQQDTAAIPVGAASNLSCPGRSSNLSEAGLVACRAGAEDGEGRGSVQREHVNTIRSNFCAWASQEADPSSSHGATTHLTLPLPPCLFLWCSLHAIPPKHRGCQLTRVALLLCPGCQHHKQHSSKG